VVAKPYLLPALFTILWCSLFAPLSSRAEIVIDNFVDSLHISLPAQKLQTFISSNIGDLSAQRRLAANFFQTNPDGYIDVNQATPGSLVAQIPMTTHTGTLPSGAIDMVYDLSDPHGGVDLTQQGVNDAIILDFGYLAADTPLRRLQVSVMRSYVVGSIYSSSSYSSAFLPIPQSNGPFSLSFPFDTFQLDRGAPISNFDFSFIFQIEILVDLFVLNPNFPESPNFHMNFDRVRVGTVVPESSLMYDLIIYSIILLSKRHCRYFPRGCL